MIERFEGSSGQKAFFEAMRAQQCVCHNDDVANALCAAATISELQSGDTLIQVGGHDNDIYFILAGRVSILVKGRELALRRADQHVGEIAIIDRSSMRSATVVALETTVVAKVSEPVFTEIADKHPFMWRCLANELGKRLESRSTSSSLRFVSGRIAYSMQFCKVRNVAAQVDN
jgi:CRP-like cAMP-binding protein